MDIISWYMVTGLPVAIIELIAVLFIRDGIGLRLKLFYGLLGWLFWPALLVVLFIPNKALAKINVALKRAING